LLFSNDAAKCDSAHDNADIDCRERAQYSCCAIGTELVFISSAFLQAKPHDTKLYAIIAYDESSFASNFLFDLASRLH